jgi:DNA-binding CsgD family transcriptional regulator
MASMNGSTENFSTRIKNKIEEIAAVADEIPGVIIIHDLRTMAIEYMSPLGLKLIRTTLEELKKLGNMGQEYHERYFNPEDAKDYVPKLLELIKENSKESMVSFFQQVRASPDEPWTWYLSSSKVLLRDDANKPAYMITVANPIDPKHHITAKVSRLLEENNFLKQNFQLFGSLTSREKEILKHLALGKTAVEIGNELNISAATAETHRKNVRKKLKITSAYHLSMFARAFDLI